MKRLPRKDEKEEEINLGNTVVAKAIPTLARACSGLILGHQTTIGSGIANAMTSLIQVGELEFAMFLTGVPLTVRSPRDLESDDEALTRQKFVSILESNHGPRNVFVMEREPPRPPPSPPPLNVKPASTDTAGEQTHC